MLYSCETSIVVPQRLSKTIWFDAQNQPFYCEYFKYEENFGMILQVDLYDMEGKPLPSCKRYLPTYHTIM